MSERVKKTEKTRLSLTLTRLYVEALDQLVEKGIYLEPQVAIRAALRLLFRRHGLEPFWVPEDPPEKGEEEAGEGHEVGDGDVA